MSLIGQGESSIYKTSNPAEMNGQFVASKFGRGKYMLKLSDANKPNGQQQSCTTWFLVDDPDLTPIYDVRTLKLSDPQNQDEIQRLLQLGMLVMDGTTGAPRLKKESDDTIPSVATHNGNGNGTQTELISKDMLGQVLMKVITAGTQTADSNFKQALDIAKLIRPESTPQLNVEQIAELVAAKMQRTTTLTTPNGDMFETYEKMETFIQKVRGPAAALTGDGSSGWVSVVRELIGAVPMVMAGLQQLQDARNNGRQPVQRRSQQAPPSAAPAELTLPQRIEQIAVMGFEKMREGVSGVDFASYVYYFVDGGSEVFDLLSQQGGTQAVISLAAMSPKAGVFVRDNRAGVQEFLDQFFSFVPQQSEEVNGPEDAPATA